MRQLFAILQGMIFAEKTMTTQSITLMRHFSLLFLCCLLFFSGCSKKDYDSIAGLWALYEIRVFEYPIDYYKPDHVEALTGFSIEFIKDGKFIFNSEKGAIVGNWDIDNYSVQLHHDGQTTRLEISRLRDRQLVLTHSEGDWEYDHYEEENNYVELYREEYFFKRDYGL